MPPKATQTAPDAEMLKTHFAKWDNLSAWEYVKKPTTAADFEGIHVSHTSQTEHDREMRKLIQEITKNSTDYRIIRGSKEEGLWWGVKKIPEKTQDEKDLEAAEQEEQELLQKLRDTDYIAIKIAEGAVAEDEQQRYDEIKAQRAEWREQVNGLRATQQALAAKIAESSGDAQ